MTGSDRAGKVFLVGAGPGDPELLTLKGARLLEQADCVLYDNLVNRQVLKWTGPGTELIYVGKTSCGGKSTSQSEINELLVKKARAGLQVVRLKGGDPFVFGRGAEEALALSRAGLGWEVVPGISSGIAATAYAGIPVTHRGLSRSVAFVTGHESPDGAADLADWRSLATGVDTIVVFMGLSRLGTIAQELIAHGRRPTTPIAVISCGTTEEQIVLTATLTKATDASWVSHLQGPALIVIGEVVTLREQLKWFSGVLVPALAA